MHGRHRTRHLAVGLGAAALTMTLTATAAPRSATTAAERYGWGEPLPAWSDEFGYGSETGPAVPDRAKWRLAGGGPGECRPGHSDNGRRCDADTRVVGGILRMTGEADGDTGWLDGDGLQSAVYEVDWARVYDLPDDEGAS
ncbi:hypothetical protein [Streptomyces coeruleorubidus]|uniref:Uncharacterized protein n=1 Tax=Streptomyces coeruleorubidus TaxID=116188 RepID=A0A5J6ICY4_STRC4|nr:hypothetical protein [Streptomyces coeruleorubidus]QEV26717.1 hypothetical protein CP976_22975 [Streptomyces coeruleorubidus]GGT63803.1 hypothetical protein GCM10010256_21730 [Streptomyces coeruleorubidus]